MPDRTESLVLQMSADIRRLERALNQARGTTNRQLSAIEQRFDRTTQHIRRTGDEMGNDLRRAIAALGLGIAIREVTTYGDVWVTAQNKIAAAGVANENLAATMDDLVKLAKETRQEFGDIADLYARITRAGEKLQLTQDQVRKITETTAKAFVAGGASASEQAAGIIQLGQALNSGVLAGDELKSIRENAPLLAQAIADEFKTTIGGLKQLGAEGKLTSDRVAQAILKADDIQAQFAATTKTTAQAMANLRTEVTRYIGTSQTATTVTRTLSGIIDFVANNLESLADAAIVAASVLGGALAAGAIVNLVRGLTLMVSTVRTAATAMRGLQIAMAFFTGPVGAAVLAIGAALGTLAFNAIRAEGPLQRADDAIRNLGQANAAIRTDTEKLTDANRQLETAIASQGPAAILAARLEVESIQKRIAANRKLADAYKVLAENEVRAAQNDPERSRLQLAIAQQAPRAFPGVNLGGVGFPSIRERINQTPAGQLTDAQQQVADLLRDLDVFEAKVALARDALEQLNRINEITVDTTVPTLTGTDGGGGKSSLSVFRTDLEKLNDTLTEIRQSGELATTKSRAAVQAFLDYARAVGDVAAAEAELKSIEDLLAGGDFGLLRMELGKLRDELEGVSSLFSLFGLGDVDVEDLAPKQTFVDSQADLREKVRNAVKDGLKEGIRSDDWGQALRNVIAEALVEGFDDAIDKLGDLLFNLLFGSRGSGPSLLGAAATAFTFGGKSGGTAITPSAINVPTAGLKGASAIINAPLIVEGSIDAATWPKVQEELNRRDQRLAQGFPASVNAVLMDNRKQKRRV